MTGIGRGSFNPNRTPVLAQDAHTGATGPSHASSSNAPLSSAPPELPDYRRRLMERVSPQLQEYMRTHGGRRVDKKESNPPARATKLETPETSYFLQMNAARSWNPNEGRQVLGQGKEGKVRHILRQDGSEFAVKKFARRGEFRHLLDPRQIVIGSEREFAAARQLGEGPHFVKVFDLVHTEKNGELKSYLIMERLKGDDLRKTSIKLHAGVRSGAISGETARTEVNSLIRQSLEALRDFHESGLVHGDVGAWNLFREESGNVKIIDLTASHEPEGDPQPLQQTDINRLCNVLAEYAGVLSAIGTPEAQHDIAGVADITKNLQSGEHTLDEVLDGHPYFA
jgi:serine/threonine protein kinase